MRACKKSAAIAQILDFIETNCGMDFKLLRGTGVRLSGDNASALAGARLLYHRPSLLLLDEATVRWIPPLKQS